MKTPKQMQQEFNEMLGQTDFTKAYTVDALNVKQYIATLEADIRIWSDFGTDTAKARVQITQQHLDQAKELFGMVSKEGEVGNLGKKKDSL